jgi:hypothetical protein
VNRTYEHFLNPDNFLIDERDLLDFIILIKEYSKKIHFYDKKNQKDGTWYELLNSDETFLIAEISKFEISIFSVNRINLINKYDQVVSLEKKRQIFNDFFNSALELFLQVNKWYIKALKNNLTQYSSLIEIELETAIQGKLSYLLKDFLIISAGFLEKGIIDTNLNSELETFNAIWNLEKVSLENNSEVIALDENELNYAFKTITLIFNPAYEILYNIVLKSKKLFNQSLYENNNHKAHTGLIFTFLELIGYSYRDLNKITKKHLDLYFKKILKLKYLPASPSKIFVSLDIDENIDSLNINKNTQLKVGQKDSGENIVFSLDEDIQLNNIFLSHISTFFLSENKVYDHHSRFNLISGLFSKIHAANKEEVKVFNNDKTSFSTLGEEQMFLGQEEMSMNKSDVGFMIASPVLALSKSNRTIDIDFQFTIDSIKTLSDLILDISQNKNASEDVVFNEIFSSAFLIDYTAEESWFSITKYKIISPLDWSTGIIKLTFKLDKTFPGIVAFNKSVHDLKIDTDLPIIRVKINQNSFYNPYSFLNSMELSKIDLNIKVENLKSFNCYVNSEEVDISSEFEVFGAIPKQGSNLIIGTDELFNKDITKLSIGWDYTNLNTLDNSIKDYYKEYELGIQNNSFKVEVSALSNFKYSKANSSELIFDLFRDNESGVIETHHRIIDINIEKLQIKPNYKLKLSDYKEYSNDTETGYIKLKLTAPKYGFGFDMYDKVYYKIVQDELIEKSKRDSQMTPKLPNEPFSPMISDLYINYEAKSSLIFNELSLSENNFEQENSFYLISPFGLEKTFSKNLISKTTIVKSFNYEGELILGFESFKNGYQLNLLFEILKSENKNYEDNRNIDWYYSSFEGWKLFKDADILFDQTMSLMKTGILSFKIPSDISDSNNILNEKKIYIKACSKSKSNRFSLIQSIRTNSISASEVLNKLDEMNSKSLPPFSVEGFLEPIQGIIAVNQYLASFKGKNKESDMDFYVRSSELLRHKNRPVTAWDYEKFILAKFNWLSHVKCYSIDKESDELNILCIKKIDVHQNIDNIKLSAAEKKEIRIYLENFSSPFSKIKIVNPLFEDLWIKCKVSFKNISNGKGIQKLHQDFFNFICSWIYEASSQEKIGVKIKKSHIVNFLKSRAYISFITGISIIHIKKLENGEHIVFDSAQANTNGKNIEPGLPWSLFVPRNNHKIEIIEKNEYHSPEPIDFQELGIQEAFLINDDSSEYAFHNQVSAKVKSEHSGSKFNFKLKI